MKQYFIFIVAWGVSNFSYGQKFISSDSWERKAHKRMYEETLEKAQNGDPEFQFYMGNLYSNGEAIEPDFDQACYWYEKAYNKGYAKAIIPLGNLYEKNFKNFMSFTKLENAVKHKDKKALTEIETVIKNIEDLYVKGISLVSDGTDKNQMFDKLLRFLDFRVEFMDNLEDINEEDDNSRVLNLCKLASESGSSKASHYLGLYYWHHRNIERSTKYFLIAADKGYPDAQRAIGLRYYWGLRIPQNINEGFKYLRMFALNPNITFIIDKVDDALKDGTMLHHLATCYRYGKGTPINSEVADLWDALGAIYKSDDAFDYICQLANEDLGEYELYSYVFDIFSKFISKHKISSKNSKIILAFHLLQYRQYLVKEREFGLGLLLGVLSSYDSDLSELDKFTIYQYLSLWYRTQNNTELEHYYKNKLEELNITSEKGIIRIDNSDVEILIPNGFYKWLQDLFVDILKKY